MDFYEVIKSRRSVRKFDPNKTIPQEVLERVLEAGRIAPSASNRQPWRFLVVKSPKARKQLCQSYKQEWLKDAPLILVVIGNKEESYIRSGDNHNSIEVDLTIAMDHMILAAANEEVGTCWIIAYDPDKLKEFLHLKDNEYVSCITPLGYPPDDYKKREMPAKKDFSEIVEII